MTLIVVTQLLSGCIGPLVPVARIDQDSQARLASQIRVYRIGEQIEGSATRLGGISATSCKNLLTDPTPSEQDAFSQLRYHAVQAGGNVVLDTLCESEGTNLAKNCWSSISCRGTAARIEQAVAGAALGADSAKSKKSQSSGSGFLIGSNGTIVTNHHVIDGCESLRIHTQHFEYNARIVASDESNDLAVVQAEAPVKLELLTIRSSPAKLAEPVAALGYPLPGVLSPSVGASTGTISSLSGIRGDTRFIQINAPIQPGNSGGPLIDEHGAVIGVIVSKLNALYVARVTGDIPQNVNFAIGIRPLQTFLEARGIPYTVEEGLGENLSTAAERATSATVQVICNPSD